MTKPFALAILMILSMDHAAHAAGIEGVVEERPFEDVQYRPRTLRAVEKPFDSDAIDGDVSLEPDHVIENKEADTATLMIPRRLTKLWRQRPDIRSERTFYELSADGLPAGVRVLGQFQYARKKAASRIDHDLLLHAPEKLIFIILFAGEKGRIFDRIVLTLDESTLKASENSHQVIRDYQAHVSTSRGDGLLRARVTLAPNDIRFLHNPVKQVALSFDLD